MGKENEFLRLRHDIQKITRLPGVYLETPAEQFPKLQ
jgi:hypothetical protein